MGETRETDTQAKDSKHREGKYLTFALAGEEYGLPILMIKEIIGLMPYHLYPRGTAICERRDQSPWQGDSGGGPEA